MNLKNFAKGSILLVFIGSLFIPSTADAKAFGKECYTETTGGDGSCFVTKEVCDQKFLWITVGTSVNITSIYCPVN